MTPIVWVAAGGVLASALAFGGGVSVGMGIGEDREYAKRSREDDLVAGVSKAAQDAAAAAIGKIKPRNVTIRQETQREIETRTEYRTCAHTPEQLQRINEALTGVGPVAPGASQLPGVGAPQ